MDKFYFCKNCGERLRSSDRECINCGEKRNVDEYIEQYMSTNKSKIITLYYYDIINEEEYEKQLKQLEDDCKEIKKTWFNKNIIK